MRTVELSRKTKETDIRLQLNLDGSGLCEIHTGIGFFDHMLTAFAVHAGFDLSLAVTGDLEVDCHHTVEDVGIVLGQALGKLTVDKTGLARYGSFFVPMDESLALCSLDLSGRAYLKFDCAFAGERVGTFDVCMAEEFFRAVADHARMTLHLKLWYGKNDHHKLEALFKAFAHALKQAVSKTGGDAVLSSKGSL